MAESDSLSDIVYEEVFLSAKKLGVSQSISDDMARMVDDGIRRRCGGDRVYVPVVNVEARDARLLSDHLGGAGIEELMLEYGLSRPGVYKRLKKIKG